MSPADRALSKALWRIYYRSERPRPWVDGCNLPWDDPEFSQRMLEQHLDESHGAATRVERERLIQIDWLWSQMGLKPGSRLLDITCGPGLYAVEFATRGCQVTGIDFSPASLAYARQLAKKRDVAERCNFLEQDLRTTPLPEGPFDGALFIYGQLAVFPRQVAQHLLAQLAASLEPGAGLCVELLDQSRVDKDESNWWYTDDQGLWGDAPFLHLGERFWNEEERCSLERFIVLHLETGELDEITLCDQTYATAEMVEMMNTAGFDSVDRFPAWAGLDLYDAQEWQVYLARR